MTLKKIQTISVVTFIGLFSFIFFLVWINNPQIIFQISNNNDFYTIVSIKGNPSSVHIPAYHNDLPVKVIGSRAFSSQRNLAKVTFDDDSQVTLIERLAFGHNRQLVEVYLPDSLQEIAQNAFLDNFNLTSVHINDTSNLRHIGGGAFSRSNISRINLPEGLETIGSMAFFGNENLTSVRFPTTITAVNVNAFSFSGLKSIQLPKNLMPLESGSIPVGFDANWINQDIIIEQWS